MKLFFWCKKVQLLRRDREKDVYAPVGMGWGAGTVVKVILWAYKNKGMEQDQAVEAGSQEQFFFFSHT